MTCSVFGKATAILTVIGLVAGCDYSRQGPRTILGSQEQDHKSSQESIDPEITAVPAANGSEADGNGPADQDSRGAGAVGAADREEPPVAIDHSGGTGLSNTPDAPVPTQPEPPAQTPSPQMPPSSTYPFEIRNTTIDSGLTAGSTFRFTVSVVNHGPNARDVVMMNRLRLNENDLRGAKFDCEGNTPPVNNSPSGGFYCEFPEFPSGVTKFISVWASVHPSTCPSILTSLAQVHNTASYANATAEISCGSANSN